MVCIYLSKTTTTKKKHCNLCQCWFLNITWPWKCHYNGKGQSQPLVWQELKQPSHPILFQTCAEFFLEGHFNLIFIFFFKWNLCISFSLFLPMNWNIEGILLYICLYARCLIALKVLLESSAIWQLQCWPSCDLDPTVIHDPSRRMVLNKHIFYFKWQKMEGHQRGKTFTGSETTELCQAITI